MTSLLVGYSLSTAKPLLLEEDPCSGYETNRLTFLLLKVTKMFFCDYYT